MVQFKFLSAAEDLLVIGYYTDSPELAPGADHLQVIIIDQARISMVPSVVFGAITPVTLINIGFISRLHSVVSSAEACEGTIG